MPEQLDPGWVIVGAIWGYAIAQVLILAWLLSYDRFIEPLFGRIANAYRNWKHERWLKTPEGQRQAEASRKRTEELQSAYRSFRAAERAYNDARRGL